MKDEKQKPNARRKALKTMVISSGVTGLAALPTSWKKPVVSSVILPAHAQTSPGAASGSVNDCNANVITGSYGPNTYNFTVTNGTFDYNGTFDPNTGSWSFNAVNGTSQRLCKDGSNSTYNWQHSGTVGSTGSGSFERFCGGIKVGGNPSNTNTSSYANGVLTVNISGTYNYCPDLFNY